MASVWDECALAASSMAILDKVSRKEECQRLLAVVNWCRDLDRQVITLHLLDGLNHEEVAARLEMTAVTARKRFSRAIKNVRNGWQLLTMMSERGITGIQHDAIALLREQERPERHAGLLALGDPVYEHPDKSSEPKPLPDHGLLLNVVLRGSNAAAHGLKDGDVLLAYNGITVNKKDDLKVAADGDKPVPIEVWRNGKSSRRELASGKLGVIFDPRSARAGIIEQRKLQKVLAAARGGDDNFSPLPGTRREVEALAQLFRADGRPTRTLLGTDAGEPELDRLASAGELPHYAFIHLATHGVINEGMPPLSAVILTQTGLPDPLDQVLNHKPAYDGRLLVREIQRTWDLKAELVTLSACETALGRESGGEGFVGFTQALLMSGARSVCLSLWKVDDTAAALLMTRFYQNVLGKRSGLAKPMPKADALREAKEWLRHLSQAEADQAKADLPEAPRGAPRPKEGSPVAEHPYEHPHYWAAFILTGDPD